jgi:uncharacterized protein (PEP-CTERM system associated)
MAAGVGLACAQAAADAAPTAAAPPPETAASQAGNPPPRFSLEVRGAATNNTGLDDNGMRQGDFITSLRPTLDVTHKGAGLDAEVHASATLVDFAKRSQPNGVLPDLHGSLDVTLVERWLKLEANGYLRSAESDPFGVRTDDVTAVNRRNQWGFQAGPTLQHALGSATNVVVQDQFGVTRGPGGLGGDDEVRLESNRILVRIERKPLPLGASADITRMDNRLSGAQGDSRFTLTTGRLGASALVGADSSVGALVGQDRSDYLLSSHVDPLYGAFFNWSPGPRTHLQLEVEHRWFGESGRLHLDHRTPSLAIGIEVQRQLVDALSSAGMLAQGSDVRSALASILTTRYPDPVTRAGIVDGIVASRGLQTRAAGAIDLLGDYPQLQTAAKATLALLGSRDTLSVSAYAQTLRVLTRAGDPLSGLSSATADSRQRGVVFQLEHRLAAQLSAALSGDWSKIEGLGTNLNRSEQQTWRISLMNELSLRTDLTVALQWYRFETGAVGQRSFDATLGLVGLSHRF